LPLLPDLAKSPLNSEILSQAMVIKHDQLVKSCEEAKSIGEKINGINALKVLFPNSEALIPLMDFQTTEEDESKLKSTILILLFLLSTCLIIFYSFNRLSTPDVKTAPAIVLKKELPKFEKAEIIPPPVKKISKPIVQFGSIKFEVPNDVKVTVDGTEVPQGSLGGWKVHPGNHKIQLIRLGFDPIAGEVFVKENQMSLVRVGEQP
jgi:hypothetical protein